MSKELLPFQQLDVYAAAKELAQRVHAAKIRDAELRDQATRSSKSAFLQLCEGLPCEGAPMRRKYFTEARGSLCEALGAVDLAAGIGAIGEEDAVAIQALGVRVHKMLWALMH